MEINQFAIYQLKEVPENRGIRFRSYKTLQENCIQVRYENYEQKYLGRMMPEDTPGASDHGSKNRHHARLLGIPSVSVMCWY